MNARTEVIVEALSVWLGRRYESREVSALLEAYWTEQCVADRTGYWNWCAIWAVGLIRKHEPSFGPRWGWGGCATLRQWAEDNGRWVAVGAAPVGSLLIRDGHCGILLGNAAPDGSADSVDGNVGRAVGVRNSKWDGAIVWSL